MKNLIISYLLEKTLVVPIICNKCKNGDENVFKEEETTDRLKVLGLIQNM